ncbi:bifunctional [glutamine synthetase] adenylyltransferase/[glutamine synthetase]-adenylyl-L-tyrosine phosphorylase [Streptomyces sp. ST2-7A]|uniref:bifunctional [glutamine synthetase] adenylyltransferase/[glutamine synthetase]-adenylyl-L-tyrosine phosphorylase n=1 Tax=Streptomyces sp. ST2-7A TaxID=2907214 RepID=UPI001F19D0C1|nr:bifunctional [glutamine synthetase] adenylyltransferase/[glutamine synthetase]-adenylyl-L-tyrosine phosphorylase [Streptomyces sp. ST2-7A]MCE7081580.1 bifunctional [glutamine synthetase] adenylyltransferase/[glutamine synthetase]-adenylyl-L-tyrosine phosphorylase [Streptomyces sp. ST2-7A]
MSQGGRRDSRFGQLLRRGFTDPTGAVRLLDTIEPRTIGGGDTVLLDALGATADPDLALRSLARIVEAQPPDRRSVLVDTVLSAKPLRDRLLAVLGSSEALGDHLVRHPDEWEALAAFRSAAELHPGITDFETALAGARDADGLRLAYRRALLLIAARDMSGTNGFAEAAAELADLAGATLRVALRIAGEETPDDAARCRLAVIGMGKCGGRELNYVSDVDVIFVAEPPEGVEEHVALQAATRLAGRMMRLCSDTTAEGTIWPVDPNLRPEGRNGPLVRTLGSHLAYYRRWAKTWEFQALLKARPVAGDADLGAAYHEAIAPLVWEAAARENFVPDVQRMRRRVEESIPAGQLERELKLGPGGLRDVEFAVQLLQLVHGRNDAGLRSPTTLDALAALAAGGYVGRRDAADLDTSYRFLRTVEHRIQLFRLRRTHLMPEEESELRRLGRSLGLNRDPVAELHTAWRRHASVVRRLHEKLFYRPLLDAVARLEAGAARLGPEAAGERLIALGYADPGAALRHLRALASGVSRKAAIQRTLLPVLLDRFADAADPDSGLLNFRKVSDALGATPWYLRLLRDEGTAAENLARVLSAGRFAPDLLLRAPEAVALLGGEEGLTPRGRGSLDQEVMAAVGRHADPGAAVTAVRGVRRRELFRTAAADVIEAYAIAPVAVRADDPTAHPGPTEPTGPGGGSSAGSDAADGEDTPSVPGVADPERFDRIGRALADITAATVAGALRAAERAHSGDAEPPVRLTVVGMGRFGGGEAAYGSDADVIFVHEAREGVSEEEAGKAAFAIANELRRLLQIPATDPPLLIDADLRPEGRTGPLVRSLASYAAYYRRWSVAWESQALLRAAPMAGDLDLGRRFVELIDPLRYPEGGPDADAIREIRRLKARMEAERLPRGADPTLHAKLGRGGLSDVEWTVQLLQMRHAARLPELRTPSTRPALTAAHRAGLLTDEEARVLEEAWLLAGRVRNAVMLVRGRPGDTFPNESRELGAVARYLGYPLGHGGELLDDYRRTTRRARVVMEDLFYGS